MGRFIRRHQNLTIFVMIMLSRGRGRYLRVTRQALRSFSATDEEVQHREKLLEAALGHVHELGWSEKALAQAAVDVGLPPLSHRLIERGPAEIVELFMHKKREHVNKMLAADSECEAPEGEAEAEGEAEGEAEAKAADGQGGKLYLAIEGHMEYITPHISSWPSALALMMSPEQVPHSTKLAAALADDLVQYAGLSPTRSDWYTDRAMLLSLYTSTQLFLLSDQSEDKVETKRFLEQAINKYSAIKNNTNASTLMQAGVFGLQSVMTSIMAHAATLRK